MHEGQNANESSKLVKSVLRKMPNSLIFYSMQNLPFQSLNESNGTPILVCK